MENCTKLFYTKAIILFATVQVLVGIVYAQTGANFPSSSIELALRLNYSVVFAHTAAVENTAGAHPRGIDVDVSKLLVDKINWENYRCYPRMGLNFSFVDFNSAILGKSYSAGYFLEPNYRIGNRGSFFVRGGVGLSYLTNPHDSIKNPANQSYSLAVNFFLALGIGANYRLNSHTAISFMGSFLHNSNGGFSMPNHGINFPTASLGIKYNFYNNKLPVYPKIKTGNWRAVKPSIDVGLYYSPKSGYKTVGSNPWVSQRKCLLGVFMQVSKRVSNLHAVTAMVEVYKDGALQSIKDRIGDQSGSVLAGLMLGHEFVFHHIIFSQQLGLYLYKNTHTFSQLYLQPFPEVYHRWGLRYKLSNHLYAGFNLLAHNQVADFIDVRLAYRL